MDILKLSKRQSDLLATDPALVQNGHSSSALDSTVSKQIVDAPVSKLKPLEHPLKSETSMRPTLEKYIEMRKMLGGEAQGEKFIQELASAAQFNRGPPGCYESSRLHYDLLLGRDDQIGFAHCRLMMNNLEMSDAELDDIIVNMVRQTPERSFQSEDFSFVDQNLFRSFDSTALLNLYFSFECAFNPITDDFDFGVFEDWDKLGASASLIWTLADGFHMTQQLLAELELLIAELTEIDAMFHEKTDILLLLWIQRPASVESALIGSFPDIVRHYLTARLFSLNNASGEVCTNVGKYVILPVFRFINRRSQSVREANLVMVKSIFTICNEVKTNEVMGCSFSKENETLLYAVVEECLSTNSINLDDNITRIFLRRLVNELFHRPILDINSNNYADLSETCLSDPDPFLLSSSPFLSTTINVAAENLRIQKIKLLLAIIKLEHNRDTKSSFLSSLLMENGVFGQISEVESVLEWMLFSTNLLKAYKSMPTKNHANIGIL